MNEEGDILIVLRQWLSFAMMTFNKGGNVVLGRTKIRILMVEDNTEDTKILEKCFESAGLPVEMQVFLRSEEATQHLEK